MLDAILKPWAVFGKCTKSVPYPHATSAPIRLVVAQLDPSVIRCMRFTVRMSSNHSAVPPAASKSPKGEVTSGYAPSGIRYCAAFGKLNPAFACPVPSPPKLGGGP